MPYQGKKQVHGRFLHLSRKNAPWLHPTDLFSGWSKICLYSPIVHLAWRRVDSVWRSGCIITRRIPATGSVGVAVVSAMALLLLMTVVGFIRTRTRVAVGHHLIARVRRESVLVVLLLPRHTGWTTRVKLTAGASTSIHHWPLLGLGLSVLMEVDSILELLR